MEHRQKLNTPHPCLVKTLPDIWTWAQGLPVWTSWSPAVPIRTWTKLSLFIWTMTAITRWPAPVHRAHGGSFPFVARVRAGRLWHAICPIHISIPAVICGTGRESFAPICWTSSSYQLVVATRGLVAVRVGCPIGTFWFKTRTSPVCPEVFTVISVRLWSISVCRRGLFIGSSFTSVPFWIPFVCRLRGLRCGCPFTISVIAPCSVSVVFRATQASSTPSFWRVSLATLAISFPSLLLVLLAFFRWSSSLLVSAETHRLSVSRLTSVWRCWSIVVNKVNIAESVHWETVSVGVKFRRGAPRKSLRLGAHVVILYQCPKFNLFFKSAFSIIVMVFCCTSMPQVSFLGLPAFLPPRSRWPPLLTVSLSLSSTAPWFTTPILPVSISLCGGAPSPTLAKHVWIRHLSHPINATSTSTVMLIPCTLPKLCPWLCRETKHWASCVTG